MQAAYCYHASSQPNLVAKSNADHKSFFCVFLGGGLCFPPLITISFPFLNSFFSFSFLPPKNDQRNRGCLGSCLLPGTGYCKKCSNFKPYRAHHCSTCNTCVQLMDHHCPWPVTRNAVTATSTGRSHRHRALEGTCWMCTSKTEPAPRPVSRLGVAVCCSPVVADVCGLC